MNLHVMYFYMTFIYAYRDVKLENLIFSDEGELSAIKIVDVGSAVKIPSSCRDGVFRDTSVVGTMGYLAPESIQYYDYSRASDIWQAGCVLYSLLSGMSPFSPTDPSQTTHRSYFKTEGVGWETISQDAKRLVKGLLHRNPSYRMTIDQILSHPWMVTEVSNEHLGLDYLTRFKYLALRQQMKSFLHDHNIDLGGSSSEVNRHLDSIIPAFMRQSSSLSTTEGTPSPFKRRKNPTRAQPEMMRDGSWLTQLSPLSTPDGRCVRGKGPMSTPPFRFPLAALELTPQSSPREDPNSPIKSFRCDSTSSCGSGFHPHLSSTRISYETFESIVLNSDLPELATRQMFDMFDKEKKGYLDMKDFLLTMLACRPADYAHTDTQTDAQRASPSPRSPSDGPLQRPSLSGDCAYAEVSDNDDTDVVVSKDFVLAFQESIRPYLSILDLNDTGFVALEDVKVAVSCYFLDVSNPIRMSDLYVHSMSRIEGLIRGLKVTSDGRLSIEEFKKFCDMLLASYSHSTTEGSCESEMDTGEEKKPSGLS